MPRVERGRELARKRKRKEKLRKYRAQFAKATDRAEKEALIEKVRKISPLMTLEEPKK